MWFSGLGHYGIILAKALGAKRVVGISRKREKRNDVLKMGADEYIATEEDEGKSCKIPLSLECLITDIAGLF